MARTHTADCRCSRCVVASTEGSDLLRDCARSAARPSAFLRTMLPPPSSFLLSLSLRPGHRIGIRLRRSERGKLFPTKLESDWNRHASCLPSFLLPPTCNLTEL